MLLFEGSLRIRRLIRVFAFAFVMMLGAVMQPSGAKAACTVPNSISNGQVADATDVMGNFNAVASCADSKVAPTGTPVAGNLSVFSSADTITGSNLSGDCTTAGSTTVTCTKSNGVALSPLATSSDAGQLTGTISVNRFNSGTNADSSHFLRGDGVWATPPVSGSSASGWPRVAPIASDFSTVRTGTGLATPTIADVSIGSGVRLTFVRNSTASNWRQAYLLRSAPAVPFRAEALIVNPRESADNYFMVGLAVGSTNAADVDRHLSISDYMDGAKRFPYSHRNTGLNAQESNFTTLNAPTNLEAFETQFWMAIEWDGTNIKTYASFDGYTWWLHGVEPDTFFTGDPDLVGFSWEAVASDGGTQYVWCPHFYITTNLNEPFGLNRS